MTCNLGIINCAIALYHIKRIGAKKKRERELHAEGGRCMYSVYEVGKRE